MTDEKQSDDLPGDRAPVPFVVSASSPEPPQMGGGGSTFSFTEAWVGDVPSPRALEHFEQIVPGSADRLIREMERNGAHRRKMERADVQLRRKDSERGDAERKRGQILCVLIVVLFLIAAVGLGLAGHATLGAVLGGMPLATIAVAMLGRKFDPARVSNDADEEV